MRLKLETAPFIVSRQVLGCPIPPLELVPDVQELVTSTEWKKLRIL